MSRLANLVVAAAVAALGVVAAWDALGRAPAEPAVSGPEPELVAELRALGASGQVLFSDGSCARWRLLLPSLELSSIPRIVGCSVFGHRGSIGVVGGEVGWYAYPGGVTMLLTRPQLARELGAPGSRVVAAAWLANTRYAVLVERPEEDGRLLALFEAARLERVLARLDGGFRELRSSPGGGWFAALDGAGGLALYDDGGGRVPLPGTLERPVAIAWSRDDRLAGVADDAAIVLFAPGPADPQAVRLALQATDLAWRR